MTPPAGQSASSSTTMMAPSGKDPLEDCDAAYLETQEFTEELAEKEADTSLSSASMPDRTGAGGADLTLKRRPWRTKPTPWREIVGHTYPGRGVEGDPFIVAWLPEDTENPYNYGFGHKWSITIIAATGTLVATMGSSILSAAIGDIKKDFPGWSAMHYTLVTCIYILGFVLGPFLWGPGSEVFGRRWIYLVTQPPLTIFDAAVCGSNNMHALLALRFLAGVFGCATMTNAGGIISDMFEAKDRGLAMGVFGAMPWLGPCIGPIVGGFLSEASNWRWVAAVLAFFAAILCALHLLFLPETYAQVLLRQRANRLSAATGMVYRSPTDAKTPFDMRTLVARQLKVPYILLFTEPIVAVLSLYMACVFGILYMTFTSFPLVFQVERHWSAGVAALAFIGMSVGSNLALVYMIWWGNPAYVRNLKAKGYLPPEARLPSAIMGAFMMPIGLIIFAWTAVPVSIHWSICILATVPYGAGMVWTFLATQNYLVDAYLPTAASVIAGATVVRSIVGACLPLFTIDMYHSLGINWATSLVAFISFAFTPMPLILIKYGRRIRRMTKHGRLADDHGIAVAEKRMEAMRAEREQAEADATATAENAAEVDEPRRAYSGRAARLASQDVHAAGHRPDSVV